MCPERSDSSEGGWSIEQKLVDAATESCPINCPVLRRATFGPAVSLQRIQVHPEGAESPTQSSKEWFLGCKASDISQSGTTVAGGMHFSYGLIGRGNMTNLTPQLTRVSTPPIQRKDRSVCNTPYGCFYLVSGYGTDA